MENEESVKAAQNHLDSLQKEYLRNIDRIDSQIEDAKKHNFAPLLAQLTGERQANVDRYYPAIQAAQKRIEDAKTRESETNKALEARRAEAERLAKEQGLLAWKQAGGDPVGFDAAWPEIRRAQLSEVVLQKMRSAARSSSLGISL